MSQKVLLSSASLENTKDFISVSAPYNNALIIINVNEEEFTDKMKRELAAIRFTFYVSDTNSSDKIMIKNQTYLWNTREDGTIKVSDIPKDCFLKITACIDKYLYDVDKNYEYEETYPISIIFDNSNTIVSGGNSSGSGGSSNDEGSDNTGGSSGDNSGSTIGGGIIDF